MTLFRLRRLLLAALVAELATTFAPPSALDARARWHRARVDGVVLMDDGDGRDGPGGGLQV